METTTAIETVAESVAESAAGAAATMDKTTSIVCVVAIVICLVGAIVLLFIGFRDTNREFKKDDGAHLIPRKVLIRTTFFLIGALLCVSGCYFAMNYKSYYDGTCSLGELIFACFVAVLRSFGWIVLIPWLMNLFRKTAPRRNDTDKM